jgi:predicted metal-binding membrane protein
MWAVMMVGMMAPSAAPMILTYPRVGQQWTVEGKPFVATVWFAAGRLLVNRDPNGPVDDPFPGAHVATRT